MLPSNAEAPIESRLLELPPKFTLETAEPLNALLPIELRRAGRSILSSEEVFSNAFACITSSSLPPLANVTLSSLLQPLNALAPIISREEGRLMLSRWVLPENAFSLIIVTPSGTV